RLVTTRPSGQVVTWGEWLGILPDKPLDFTGSGEIDAGPVGEVRDLVFDYPRHAVTLTPDRALVRWLFSPPTMPSRLTPDVPPPVTLAVDIRPDAPVRFDPAGARVATVTSDGSVRVFSAEGSAEPRVIRNAAQVQWTEDGAEFVTASSGGEVLRCR